MEQNQDTIFAPSTAIGGAIAIIRISGKDASRVEDILDRRICGEPGRLRFAHIFSNGETIDDVMAVFFKGPQSYTGEDMAEINCHGGPQTVRRILEMMTAFGFRPAAGGEFTRRAFLNGKMDLSQAEAVMDIITAEAEQSRKAALDQLHGSVSRAVHEVEETLLDALSSIDAAIDYPEEVEEDCMQYLPEQMAKTEHQIENLISEGRRGKILRDGVRVVIIGKPNVGKSSVLNALTGSDRAIVTDIEGTTRDVLDEKVSFSGVPIRLVDTAGIRETENAVEKIGIDRAMDQIQKADIVLAVFDSGAERTEEDEKMEMIARQAPRYLSVGNKCDLPRVINDPKAIYISAKTGEGLDRLKQAVLNEVIPSETDHFSITNERHLGALERAYAAVRSGGEEKDLDCRATDIRTALFELGSITGSDVDADVIDRIFEKFCVGK